MPRITSHWNKNVQPRKQNVKHAVNWDILQKLAMQKTFLLIPKKKNNIFYVDLRNSWSNIESINALLNAQNSLKEVTITVNSTPIAAIVDSGRQMQR